MKIALTHNGNRKRFTNVKDFEIGSNEISFRVEKDNETRFHHYHIDRISKIEIWP